MNPTHKITQLAKLELPGMTVIGFKLNWQATFGR